MCLVPASLALVSLAFETLKASGHTGALPRLHLPAALVPIAALVVGVSQGLVVVGSAISVGLSIVALRGLVIAGRTADVSARGVIRLLTVPAAIATASAVTVLAMDRTLLTASHQPNASIGWALLALEGLSFAALYLTGMYAFASETTRDVVTRLRDLRPAKRRG
jgi:hypothetical protein